MSNTDFTEQAIPDVGRPQPQPPQQPRQGGTMPAADMPDAGGGQPPQPGDQAGDLGDQLGSPWSRKVPTAPVGGPRQPYMRSRGPYRPSDWGQPDYILSGARNYPGLSPGPWMPQLQDVSPLVRQAVQYLTQHGSGPVAAMAANMGLSRGAYDKAFIQGQIARAKYEHEQYAWHQEALIQKQTEELREAAAIYDAYQDDPHQMQQKLLELAQKNQDDKLAHVVQNGSLQGVKHYLDERNVYLGDLSKIAEQRDKHRVEAARADVEEQKAKAARAEDDIVRQYLPGYKGSPPPPEPDTGPDPSPDTPPSAAAPADEQPQTGDEDTGDQDTGGEEAPPSPSGAPPAAAAAGGPTTPAAPGTPPTPAAAAPAAAPAAPSGGAFPALPSGQTVPGGGKGAIPLAQPAPAAAATSPPINPLDTLSDSLLRGQTPGPKQYPDAVLRAGALDANRKQGEISRILADPNIKPEQVIPEIRKRVGASVAEDLENILHYRSALPSGGFGGGGTRIYNRDLTDLARKANPGDPSKNKPGWSQSTFDAVKRFKLDSLKDTSPIKRIPTAVSAGKEALKILDRMQARNPGVTSTASPQDFEAALGKDPEWSRFKLMWTRYNEDVDVIARGSASVTMTEKGIESVPQTPYLGSFGAYRSAIGGDMDQVISKMGQIHNAWDQLDTGDVMPGYNPQMEADAQAIATVDPTTGGMKGSSVRTPFDWDK